MYIHLLSYGTHGTTEFALLVRHLAADCQGGYSSLRPGVATDRIAGDAVHRATGFVAGRRGFAGEVGRESGDRQYNHDANLKGYEARGLDRGACGRGSTGALDPPGPCRTGAVPAGGAGVG